MSAVLTSCMACLKSGGAGDRDARELGVFFLDGGEKRASVHARQGHVGDYDRVGVGAVKGLERLFGAVRQAENDGPAQGGLCRLGELYVLGNEYDLGKCHDVSSFLYAGSGDAAMFRIPVKV